MGIRSEHGGGLCLLADRLDPATPAGTACLYFWGRGNTAATLPTAYWNGIARDVAEAGFPVLSSDFASSTHWGRDTAISAVDATLAAYGRADEPVVLLGISMGAQLALNWARQHPERVQAIALVTPAVDVEDIRANNRNGYAAEIAAAYTDNTGWQAARATHNPADYAAELTGVPIRAWYSTDDAVISAGTVTSFASAAGGDTVSLGAVGHTAGSLDGQDVADFLLAHA